MIFTAREDVEAPIDFVFGQVTDFPVFERMAIRHGADVRRTDNLKSTGPGMAWHAAFELRGKRRQMDFEMTRYEPPSGFVMESRSPNMGGHMVVDLVALSRGRTRISVETALNPKSLTSRLLVQSMKLAQRKLTQRFRTRVATFAEGLEDRYSKTV